MKEEEEEDCAERLQHYAAGQKNNCIIKISILTMGKIKF